MDSVALQYDPREVAVEYQVRDVLSAASPSLRAGCAARIAAEFGSGAIPAAGRETTAVILKVLARDAEREVRQAIALQLKTCPFLPPELARSLAADVEQVALPIIRHSTVLDDDDLISIVRTGGEAKQVAVAGRRMVSERVSDTLVGTDNGRVLAVLLANGGAEIAEHTLRSVVDGHGADQAIQGLLVRRPSLPLSVAEQLFAGASDAIRRMIVERHDIPSDLAERVVSLACEGVVTRRVSREDDVEEIERFAGDMQRAGRLTPTLLLRALCQGDIRFFEAGMAAKANAPLDEARACLYGHGLGDFRAFYRRTDLPEALFGAFRAALAEFDAMQESGVDEDPGRFTRRVIERLVMEYPEVCPESLDHVISQISSRVMERHATKAG